MAIKSICPKCGEMGSQAITYHPNKAKSKFNYLEMVHGKKKRCYIGRIRTTDEAMSEFNKPESKKEYEETLRNLTKDIRKLIDHYSPNTAVSMKIMSKKLLEILKKHGY